MFQIKSPYSFLGHNHCIKPRDGKEVLFLIFNYVEISAFLKSVKVKY